MTRSRFTPSEQTTPLWGQSQPTSRLQAGGPTSRYSRSHCVSHSVLTEEDSVKENQDERHLPSSSGRHAFFFLFLIVDNLFWIYKAALGITPFETTDMETLTFVHLQYVFNPRTLIILGWETFLHEVV